MLPYVDDYLSFDEISNQYILTERALLDYGIDLRARLAGRKAVSPEAIINGLLTTVSEQIYGFIHEYSLDNARQDVILARSPEVRPYMYRALMQHAIHVLNVGNLTYSVKAEERASAINGIAKQILGQTIPTLGKSILYTGG